VAQALRLLLVEDSDEDALLVESALARQGFELFLERVDSEAGLAAALAKPWDVVLSDYSLPGLSGLRALEIVKKGQPDLAVVMYSGSVEETTLVEAMRAGASDYILKGNLSRLATVLQRELRDAEAKRRSGELARGRHEEEERFRFVVERTGEVLYRLRFDSMRYDYISPGIERLTGFAPEALNQRGFASLVVGVRRPAGGLLPRALLEAARDRGEASEFWADYEIRTRSGERRWLSDHSYPWHDEAGRLVGSVGMLSDISERRRGEEVLRESEERYRVLYQKERAGREQADRLRTATLALGTTLELREVLALILQELQRIIPYDSASVQEVRGEHMQIIGGHGFKNFDEILGTRFALDDPGTGNPNREVMQKRVTVVVDDAPARYPAFGWDAHAMTPIRSWMGVPLVFGDRLIGMITLDKREPGFYNESHVPVAESFAAQAAIAMEHARLYAAARQELDERKRIEAELRQAQKMEAVGRLAGGIAHDFNNLLGVILGYTELASLRIGADSPAQSKLEQVRKAAERAAALTGQLLAFSRKQVLVPEVLDLASVVTEMSTMLHRVIGEDTTLVPVLHEGLGAVRADRSQISQAILNLVVNARDAMPRGGRLVIEARNVDVSKEDAEAHRDVTPGAYVVLSVSDTGVGMGQEVLSHVFEPFFTTKEQGKGTGLGLAMVYGLLQQSGGHVTVESEVDRGTTFRLYLPRVDATAPAAAAPADAPRGGAETILLVEDETSLRELTREVLAMSGYTVLEAEHADKALEVSGSHAGTIDLLLTDVVMPGASGGELAQRLVALRPGIRVAFMSGYTDEARRPTELVAAGAAFIQKPFGPTALLAAVREALDRKP
jgi:PAS domain S-box-containing protein